MTSRRANEVSCRQKLSLADFGLAEQSSLPCRLIHVSPSSTILRTGLDGTPSWGDPPPMLSAVAQAALEGDLAGKVHVLASDPKDGLAAALARLGRAFMARDS